ncbi:hypothetical protein MKZ38_009445 [Zalerion maritima]|uniref:Uncharacterized protein n=1 Tax=Zalerion maritima TaxID=339359 RepID=A0AAD5RTA3_9PEZI|nr:hypothetical protein MKZ38_009445 [Zalerion maritima]
MHNITPVCWENDIPLDLYNAAPEGVRFIPNIVLRASDGGAHPPPPPPFPFPPQTADQYRPHSRGSVADGGIGHLFPHHGVRTPGLFTFVSRRVFGFGIMPDNPEDKATRTRVLISTVPQYFPHLDLGHQ